MDDIDPGFRDEAGIFFRLPAVILIMSILIIATVDAVLIYIKNNPQIIAIIIFSIAGLMTAIFAARKYWIKWLKFRKELIEATLLLNTITSESIQVKSFNRYSTHIWYVEIKSMNNQEDIPNQFLRIKLPFIKHITIDNPVSAEIFRNEHTTVIRLQDNQLILIASEKNTMERLTDCPLPSIPRRIPLLIQFQIFTCYGFGLFFALGCFCLCFSIFSKITQGQELGTIIMSGICFLFSLISIKFGYHTLNNLRYASLGWAISTEVIPPAQNFGLLLPEKQSIHLHIRDQQGNEYNQIITTREPSIWPTFVEVPVLFDPTGNKKIQHISEILGVSEILGFCRINKKGDIVYHPGAVVLTILYMIMFVHTFKDVFLTK